MNIENEICSSVISVVKELYGQDVHENMVQLQKTRSNFEGNLTLVVFPFLKISKKKPEDTAKEIGFPLIVKAASGGGGRGMRIVERVDTLLESVQAAQRDAEMWFGDDTVYMERFLQNRVTSKFRFWQMVMAMPFTCMIVTAHYSVAIKKYWKKLLLRACLKKHVLKF